MARRNPMNARYQKNTAPAGKTRRSASAAKPKRDNAAGSSSKPSAKAGPKATPKRQPPIVNPPTPEYRRLRRTWWILLGSSVLLAVASFLLWRETSLRTYGNVTLALSYALIGGAIYLDFVKIRPVRLRYMETLQKPAGKKQDADKTSESSARDKS